MKCCVKQKCSRCWIISYLILHVKAYFKLEASQQILTWSSVYVRPSDIIGGSTVGLREFIAKPAVTPNGESPHWGGRDGNRCEGYWWKGFWPGCPAPNRQLVGAFCVAYETSIQSPYETSFIRWFEWSLELFLTWWLNGSWFIWWFTKLAFSWCGPW